MSGVKQSAFSVTYGEQVCVLSPSGFKSQGKGMPVWRGGESEALERLNKHLDRKVNPREKKQHL